MYLGQALIYLDRKTVKQFVLSSDKNIPEVNVSPRHSTTFDLNNNYLEGDILNREVISIGIIGDKINLNIE